MRSILKLALRVLILLLFINTINVSLGAIAQYLRASQMYEYYNIENSLLESILPAIIAFLFSTILLVILWWKTDWLVRILVGNLDDNQLVINISNFDIIPMTLRILGLVLVLTSLPSIFGAIAYYARIYSYNNAFREIADIQIQQDVTLVATIFLGILLLIGKNRLVNFFRAIRDFINNPDNNSDAISRN